MERRRAAAALLVLAACIVCCTAAPTASNPTALDLHDGPTEGCYYNFQHYGEGDRIMTNEPCLNCTCHNRMLMCYLRVCPFTKAIGQDCTVEKRADQCCPIVTCPDVPVDLLTSTSTSSPAEYGPTGVGKLDKYGCSINNKYFPEGSKVPSSPNKPCEHCYCIRNMTTCVMQECTLHVDGCTPIYHKDVCCPVRYSCDHSEDEIPLLDDMTTTVRPTQGFLLTTTTMMPVTQMTQDCIHDEQIFPDGASIKTDKACEHCYCMKGDIVCVVQECGTPMENEGKNCTSLPPRQGQCCPDTYICEGDEPSVDLTTETIDLTSVPPRRLGVEGSGYRNEPDEPITEKSPFEHDIEGSGDVSESDIPTKVSSTIKDELLLITTEKESLYSQTTEADKRLNTIIDEVLEKEPSVTFEEDSFIRPTESILLTSTESKATMADEIVTSEGVTSKHEDDIIDTENPLHSYERDEVLPIDISIEKETSSTSPEQSTKMDEHSEYGVTETIIPIQKETENILVSTDSVAPYDATTTEHPIILSVTEKDSNDETSEIDKIDIASKTTEADLSVTEQNKPDFDYSTVNELHIVDDATTVSSNKDGPETTSINPVDNEVDNISGRIPGEGDCLVNGIRYSDNASVPSTNNCHTGCKCISSIVKCDPIICSPPPEYMENMNDCQTSYDSPDACCPTFVCSAKETSLPQSHSQTSVTESSKPAPEECNSNDCGGVKQPSIEPHTICDSDNCDNEQKQNECGINGCQSEEQPPLEHPVICSGDKCSASPIGSCDGGNCETVPTEEKNVDDKTHSVLPSKPICNDDGGCDNIKDTSSTQDECKDETCRRKDTFETDTNIQPECSGPECKIDNQQNIPLIEPTIAPVTEYILNEKDTEPNSQKTASPLPNIITPEKAITTESTMDITGYDYATPSATVEEQLPEKTLTNIITTEEPTKLITENAITGDSVTKIDNIENKVTVITENPQEEIIKSETSPMSESATEIIKTSDEASTEQGSYTRAPGQGETEAFTESKLVDDSSENKDISSQEYTKEVSQTTTQKSETLSDIYETKSDESFTKLPFITDTEREINTMKIPDLPANEVDVTRKSEDYPLTTEKLEAISVNDEKISITLQPTKMQENEQTELPASAIEIQGGNEDHSELIPTEPQVIITEIAQTGEADDYNKFTTVKSITLPEVSENLTPMETEIPSKLLETGSSESTIPIETISTEIDKTYTELPQTIGTKSDTAVDSDSYITIKLDDSDNLFKEPTTPSSDVKVPEEISTKLDEAISGDGHSKPETEKQENVAAETEPSTFNDNDLNVVTERQTTVSQIKYTDKNYIEQEIQTKQPIVDTITEKTELQMTEMTESHKETDIGDYIDKDSQTVSTFVDNVTEQELHQDITVTESAQQYTSYEGPAGELTSKNPNLDLQTSTSSQDISETKDTSTAAVLRDEGDVEIMSSTDKNEIKVTSSSDDSVTETKYHADVTEGEELTTLLPIEKIEQHYPTKELKLTTAYSDIPIETTTSVSISEEKLQTPDLEIPEKTMGDNIDRIKDITTESPSFTKDLSDEDILPVKIPELISHTEDTTDIPNDNERATISIYNTKEEITEDSFDETTISNIHISEIVTENINMQPQEYPTQESSADDSSKKPDVNENDLIKESPHSQTGPINFDEYSTSAPDKYEADQTPTLPVTEINNDKKPISTSVTLLTQDNEILTEKIPTSATAEKDSTTEKYGNDINLDKHEQPNEPVVTSTESNTEQDIFQNTVTEDKQIGTVEKVTEISTTAYESEMQNIGSSGSVQENEKPSSDVPKQTTEVPFESELTTQQEYQTVASIPKEQSTSELPFEGMPTLNQEDVGTTESVPIKQEDLPMHSEMPIDNIYTTNDLMTTNIVPIMHDELPKQPDIPSIDTDIPEHDRMGGEEDISNIETATLSTESFITSQPSLTTSPEASKTDTTKLTDMLEEQPIPSKMPESVVESTSQTEIESVTKQEDVEPYTTEKQYVSKSDQEEVPKITELPEEQITVQTETETVKDQKDLGTLTTEVQHVTKSDSEDIPKIPVIIDEQNTPQSDIESVTKLDVTVPYTTEKQYVTESNKEIPEISIVTEEQSTDKTHTEVVNKEEDSEPFSTERTYVTKVDKEIPKLPEQIEEQSTSRTDTESVTKLDDTEPLVTEKQYVTNSGKDEEPKITVLSDEESTSQSVTELITNLNGIEPYTTEKQYVTKSDEVEVPKIPELSGEQSTDRTDTEFVSKQGDSGSITTESQYVTKSDQEDIPKIPGLLDEQSTSQSDIEGVTKLDDTESFVTEKQYMTNSDQEESSKIPARVDEESTSQNDMESITKLNDMEPFTTEKQQVTKSNEEVPETPAQTTDRTDIEFVSKAEVVGSFTTESPHMTKLEDDIPKTPEEIEDQSTSRYDSESVTKLDDTEASVTEKQYVSNLDQEATPKFPILSEEQSTSRIDTESVTMLDDSGTDHEETSHKLDVDISKPEQDSTNTENINTEPLSYPDTTVKSETEGSELFKPSEDVTEVPQKEDSPEIIATVRPSIPQKDETPIESDTENIDDFEKYSTERNVQTNVPEETVTLEEVMDSKPHEIDHKTPSKSSTEDEGIYSETTPYSVLLEEHTHSGLEDISSIIPIEEDSTTVRNEVQPERVGQIPDTPETNDEYEHTTPKQIEEERTTPYEKISGPNVHSSDDTETTTSIDKITSDTVIQDEDKKYSPSVQDEGLTIPTILPIIKDKEQHITSPTMLEKEITTLADIITSSVKPEVTSSSSKDTPELSSYSTSKLQEESTTHLPASEDKYKEKPIFSSPSPSTSEMPDILGESHEDEHLPDFPPSGAGGGYGQEPDYVEEDQSFGPGTCRYGGKVYVSAQQIPRDDPCDFCFCFRSDIICLQQSCPPPIHGCHEEPIQGFCCPRYECPVSMATTMNVTTTTTTTTTTLPPHFLPHAYKGAAQRRGCQIKGHSYKVGEVVRASSGPCLHCTCGGDGQMKCDPKACTPEPMLRQMIAAAVSAKRRR